MSLRKFDYRLLTSANDTIAGLRMFNASGRARREIQTSCRVGSLNEFVYASQPLIPRPKAERNYVAYIRIVTHQVTCFVTMGHD